MQRRQRCHKKLSMMQQRLLDNIESIVAVGESFEMRVSGYSMLPMLGRGRDTIIIRRIDVREPIVGRIAMFRTEGGNIVVHRVVECKEGVVTLKGDGNLAKCERVSRERIIGVVESVRRECGKVVECDSRGWRRGESLWLAMPYVVRRVVLGVLRRWLDFKNK